MMKRQETMLEAKILTTKSRKSAEPRKEKKFDFFVLSFFRVFVFDFGFFSAGSAPFAVRSFLFS
jgi:hypothetical protein